MQRWKRNSNFLLCFLINLVLNLAWSISAWTLLVLHIWFDISIWWFLGGLLVWFISIFVGMKLIGWASSYGNQKDPSKENKNPYSVKGRNEPKR